MLIVNLTESRITWGMGSLDKPVGGDVNDVNGGGKMCLLWLAPAAGWDNGLGK